MGYYSDVTIRCEEKAYEMFEEAWKKVDFKPYSVYEANENGNHTYVLQWIGVKWYYEFDEVEAIMSVCELLNKNNKEGYAYKCIEIGEDNATDEYANEIGLDVFEDFQVIVDVSLPSDIIEIGVD